MGVMVVRIPRTSRSKWRTYVRRRMRGTRGPRAETGPAYGVIIFSTGRKRRGGKGSHRGGLSPARSKGTRVKIEGEKVERTLLCLCKYARLLPRHTCTATRACTHGCVCTIRWTASERASERASRSSCARHAAGFQAMKAKEYMKETLITALLASQP